MPDALLNSVLSVEYNSDNDNDLLKTINLSYLDKNLSYCFWVFPDQNEKLLTNQLTLNGLHFDDIAEGMAIKNLSLINYEFNIPNNVCIKLVKTIEEFDDWIKPLTISFNLTEKGSSTYKNIFKELATNSNYIQHYVAYQSNNPVASCSIFLDQETKAASVYNCGTIPEARKQGISTALTKHGLFNAHKEGYQRAFLQASPYSKNLFENIGFESCTSYQLYVSQR